MRSVIQRAVSVFAVTAVAICLMCSRPAPASASILSLGQLIQQIGQITQMLNSPYGNLSATNGGLTGVFQQQYPGISIPGSATGVRSMLTQLIKNQLGSALGCMQSGGNQMINALFGYGDSSALESTSAAAAISGGFFADPVPSLYAQNEISLSQYDAEIHDQASQSANQQCAAEYNAGQVQLQAVGNAQLEENYASFDTGYGAFRSRGY